jgi:hypothetical protein
MKKRNSAIKLTAILTLSIATPAHAENWLCIAERATGFKYDSILKDWKTVNFKIANEKYIVRPSKNENYKYEVVKFGENREFMPDYSCKEVFSAGIFFHCEGMMGEFKLNAKNGRFLSTYIAGYWTVAPGVNENTEEGDTPTIQIGKCTRL